MKENAHKWTENALNLEFRVSTVGNKGAIFRTGGGEHFTYV